MAPNPFLTKRRIKSLVTEAIDRTRKRHQGTTWEKSIATSQGALSIKIVYPAQARGLQRLAPHYPKWRVHFSGSNSSWSLRPGNAGAGAFIEDGELPLRMSDELWRDLQAILP